MLGSRDQVKVKTKARNTIRMRVSEPSQQTNLIWGQGLLMKDSKFSSCCSCPSDWGVKNSFDAQRIEVQQWKWRAEELKVLLSLSCLCTVCWVSGSLLLVCKLDRYYPGEDCLFFTCLALMTVRLISSCSFACSDIIETLQPLNLLCRKSALECTVCCVTKMCYLKRSRFNPWIWEDSTCRRTAGPRTGNYWSPRHPGVCSKTIIENTAMRRSYFTQLGSSSPQL